MHKVIHAAVIGVGAFGRNHARVLHELEKANPNALRLAAIVDANTTAAQHLAQQYGAMAYSSVDELVGAVRSKKLRVDCASIAVPTVHHLSAAKALMEVAIDVLVEKPVAATVEEADEIERVAKQYERVVMVGQLERFNPAVRAARELITTPMFFECHRLSIFTPRSLDVDVVLDLMIHDLDVVLSMVKSAVREVRAVGLPILSKKVDIANVRVEFENGCVANFTASRVSTERVRKVRLFQPHEYLSIDYARQDIIAIKVDQQMIELLMSMAAGIPGAVPIAVPKDEGDIPGVKIAKPPVAPGEPLRAEIEEFLRAVRTRTGPAVTIADGRRALALALEINRSMQEHRTRVGLA